MNLVVRGSYDQLFLQNPHLRDLATKAHDDPHWTETMAKLNNDQEFVLLSAVHYDKLPFSFYRSVYLLQTLVGISYLQLFIVTNFLGPKMTLDHPEQPLSQVNHYATTHLPTRVFQTMIDDVLTCDGEAPMTTVQHLDYLYQALNIFDVEKQPTNAHWVKRCVSIGHVRCIGHFQDFLLVDDANSIHASEDVRRTFNDIVQWNAEMYRST